jgi:hypothetical protein
LGDGAAAGKSFIAVAKAANKLQTRVRGLQERKMVTFKREISQLQEKLEASRQREAALERKLGADGERMAKRLEEVSTTAAAAEKALVAKALKLEKQLEGERRRSAASRAEMEAKLSSHSAALKRAVEKEREVVSRHYRKKMSEENNNARRKLQGTVSSGPLLAANRTQSKETGRSKPRRTGGAVSSFSERMEKSVASRQGRIAKSENPTGKATTTHRGGVVKKKEARNARRGERQTSCTKQTPMIEESATPSDLVSTQLPMEAGRMVERSVDAEGEGKTPTPIESAIAFPASSVGRSLDIDKDEEEVRKPKAEIVNNDGVAGANTDASVLRLQRALQKQKAYILKLREMHAQELHWHVVRCNARARATFARSGAPPPPPPPFDAAAEDARPTLATTTSAASSSLPWQCEGNENSSNTVSQRTHAALLREKNDLARRLEAESTEHGRRKTAMRKLKKRYELDLYCKEIELKRFRAQLDAFMSETIVELA